MTVSTTANRISYTGDGTTTAFAFPYVFYATTDLEVYLAGVQQVLGFTVTGGNGSSGTVTFATPPTSGTQVALIRNMPYTQTADLINGDNNDATVQETALDKLTILIQQVLDSTSRALTQPTTDTTAIGSLPAAAVRADMYLAFDVNGNPIAAVDPGAYPASTYMGTVLGSASAAAMRALFTPLTTKGDLWIFGAADGRLPVGGNGQIAVANSADANGLTYGSYTIGRNRIINGAFHIDQRNSGAAQTFTAGAGIAYSVDRWYASCAGANVTGQQVPGVVSQNAYQFNGTANVTQILIGQRIESANCADLVNQQVTLQVRTANSLSLPVTWAVYTANVIDNFSAKTQIATGTFNTSGASTVYSASFNAGANAGNGIAIEFSVGAQTSGTWQIEGVQFEAGTIATPFERRLVGVELALCQRYYEKSYDLPTAPAVVTSAGMNQIYYGGVASQTNVGSLTVRFDVNKRSTPTITLYSPASGTINRIRDIGAAADLVPTVANQGQGAFFWYATQTTAQNLVNFSAHWTASAEL